MDEGIAVTLPHGSRLAGRWQRKALLRPLSGGDELQLLEEGRHLLPVARTTMLLTRCVDRIGDEPATPQRVRSLTIGDREALLLHLRRLTFGDSIQCIVTCSNPDCGERMDVDLDVPELLADPYENVAEHYELTLGNNGRAHSVRVRLPTGDDQEAAADLAMRDVAAARELLLRRCVLELETEDARVPPPVADELPEVLATLDPQAEVRLELSCTGCGVVLETVFDAGDFLFRELAVRTADLYEEIHRIALHYGWSEPDVLELSTARRRRYLELIADDRAEARRR